MSVWVTIREHFVGVCLKDKNPLSLSETVVPGILSKTTGAVWTVTQSEAQHQYRAVIMLCVLMSPKGSASLG